MCAVAERPLAVLAHVRLVAGVGAHVSGQGAVATECFSAYAALERPFASVNTAMPLQLALRRERFQARCLKTGKPLLRRLLLFLCRWLAGAGWRGGGHHQGVVGSHDKRSRKTLFISLALASSGCCGLRLRHHTHWNGWQGHGRFAHGFGDVASGFAEILAVAHGFATREERCMQQYTAMAPEWRRWQQMGRLSQADRSHAHHPKRRGARVQLRNSKVWLNRLSHLDMADHHPHARSLQRWLHEWFVTSRPEFPPPITNFDDLVCGELIEAR